MLNQRAQTIILWKKRSFEESEVKWVRSSSNVGGRGVFVFNTGRNAHQNGISQRKVPNRKIKMVFE